MDIFARFKDWHLNRKKYGSTMFVASFLTDFDPNQLKPALAELLKNEILNYYYDDFNTRFTYEDFLKIDINQIFDNSKDIMKLFSLCPDDNTTFDGISISKDIYHNMEQLGFVICPKRDFEINHMHFVNSDKLYLASYFELDYITWQDNLAPALYKYRGGLKYTKNKFGEKIVDKSDKYGRSFHCKYFIYNGSSKMWFGPQIYQFISQEKILSFEGAIEIKILDNNITFVHLYNTVYDGDEPQNQEVQRRFRKHIGIDNLKIV